MTVCIDTNVLLQMFGRNARCLAILNALLAGKLALAFSNEILLEYQEVVSEMLGPAGWSRIMRLIELMDRLYGNVLRIEPHFRFGVISIDPDDNKFCDCAIAGNADYVITEDRHFAPLVTAGYRPQPITADELSRNSQVSPILD